MEIRRAVLAEVLAATVQVLAVKTLAVEQVPKVHWLLVVEPHTPLPLAVEEPGEPHEPITEATAATQFFQLLHQLAAVEAVSVRATSAPQVVRVVEIITRLLLQQREQQIRVSQADKQTYLLLITPVAAVVAQVALGQMQLHR